MTALLDELRKLGAISLAMLVTAALWPLHLVLDLWGV